MKKILPISILCLLLFTATSLKAQNPKLTLDLTKPGANISPQLYGLMTEEINHSYDGGLYAELIRNRIFKDNPNTPEAWSLIKEGSARATIQLVAANPGNVPVEQRHHAINGALTTCLRLLVDTGGGRAGIANEGYWGIPVLPNTTYNASFYMKGAASGPIPLNPWDPKPTTPIPVIADNTAGPITVSIESNDGKTVYASGTINLIKSAFWKKYELKLTTGTGVKPTTDARFVIRQTAPGFIILTSSLYSRRLTITPEWEPGRYNEVIGGYEAPFFTFPRW
jgi:alpha-N-arabinofuranosidase